MYDLLGEMLADILGFDRVKCVYNDMSAWEITKLGVAAGKDKARKDGWAGGHTREALNNALLKCSRNKAEYYKTLRQVHNSFGGKSGANFYHKKFLKEVNHPPPLKPATTDNPHTTSTKSAGMNPLILVAGGLVLVLVLMRSKK
jgi:hypothetical protein